MTTKNKLKIWLGRRLITPLVNIFLENLEFLVKKNNFIRKKADKDIFLWDAREFIRANGIKGDYYEFGVYKCRTFTKAMKILPPYVRHYHGFDSFKGLPKFRKGDRHPNWRPESMKSSYDAEYFKNQLISQGFKQEKFSLVEGFFENTLSAYKFFQKASVLFIDCDIVSSLKTVLDFIPSLLQDGTLIYMDDFFLYKGNPNSGQQKVFFDFCAKQNDFQFSEYNNYPPFAKAFIANKIK